MGISIDRRDYGKYEYGYRKWKYRNGVFWTDAASGESYDYYTIVNELIDNGDETYKVTFNVYYAGYEALGSECYSYNDTYARNLSTYEYSGQAIIAPKIYDGKNTWELIKLERN